MSLDRTRSPTFSNERGPGAFVSLGSLPRRKSHSPVHNRKSPVFHIHGDEEHDDHYLSSSDSFDEQAHTQSDNLIKYNDSQSPAAVPFPRRSPSPPSPRPSSPSIISRSELSRPSSTILLSNGKPLKSSLKSSSSSLSIPESLEYQRPNNHLHLRSRSEPSTPTSQTPKNVHFPETDGGLASIRIFSRSARPAAVSTPDGVDETETEGEDQPSTGFPFPKFPSSPKFDIDPATSSVVPVTNILPRANVLLESLTFSYASSTGVNPHLSGTVLVRNLAYEKHVAVRFTLDEWQTVSEVTARHVVSLPSLPSVFASLPSHETTLGDLAARTTNHHGWDRFSFMIRLEDYGHNLGSRVLWLAARYRVDAIHPALSIEVPSLGGEWWDNNDGGNYRVAFRAAPLLPSPSFSNRLRRETAPEPILPSMVAPPPPTSREHACGLFVSPFTSSPSSSPTRDSKEKVSLPLRSGKLRLPNYAAPPVRPASPASSVPTQRPHSPPSPSSPSQRPALQVQLPQSHDYESPSPASSILSTPSASPNMVPRVIINGHPANYARPPHTQGSHIDDWEWTAPPAQSTFEKRQSARRTKTDPELPVSRSGLPGLPPPSPSSQSTSGIPSLPPGSEGLSGDSLYKAFVTRWCFAQGPPAHGPPMGGDGGILA